MNDGKDCKQLQPTFHDFPWENIGTLPSSWNSALFFPLLLVSNRYMLDILVLS